MSHATLTIEIPPPKKNENGVIERLLNFCKFFFKKSQADYEEFRVACSHLFWCFLWHKYLVITKHNDKPNPLTLFLESNLSRKKGGNQAIWGFKHCFQNSDVFSRVCLNPWLSMIAMCKAQSWKNIEYLPLSICPQICWSCFSQRGQTICWEGGDLHGVAPRRVEGVPPARPLNELRRPVAPHKDGLHPLEVRHFGVRLSVSANHGSHRFT
jgi:hypothetical protein